MYGDIRHVMCDMLIGPATKLAYRWMWLRAGWKPGKIVATCRDLGSAMGRTPQAAANWIDRLKEHDLIDVYARNKQTGEMHISVLPPIVPDSYSQFPDLFAEWPAPKEPDDLARVMRYRGRTLSPASKLAYSWFWMLTNGDPGEIVTSYNDLGVALGRSTSAATEWPQQLEGHDLIAIGERRRRKIQVFVFGPNPACPRPQVAGPGESALDL